MVAAGGSSGRMSAVIISGLRVAAACGGGGEGSLEMAGWAAVVHIILHLYLHKYLILSHHWTVLETASNRFTTQRQK